MAGKWRQNPERLKTFYRRTLHSSAPMTEIARRSLARAKSTQPENAAQINERARQIGSFNTLQGIRDRATARRIADEAIKKKRQGKGKVNYFNAREKQEILKKNQALVFAASRPWHENQEVRRYYPNFKDLMTDLRTYLFFGLDNHDPRKKNRSGRLVKTTTFLWVATQNFFLWKLYRRMRVAPLFQIPADSEGRPMELPKVRGEDLKATPWQLARIPAGTRSFLRNLGLDINSLALMGMDQVRETVLGICRSPRTNLTARELEVVTLKLEGLFSSDIGKKMSPRLSRERIRQVLAAAIKKIRSNWVPPNSSA